MKTVAGEPAFTMDLPCFQRQLQLAPVQEPAETLHSKICCLVYTIYECIGVPLILTFGYWVSPVATLQIYKESC